MSSEYDLTTPEGVAAYMSQATSGKDWDNRCTAVKKANGGYPEFWYATIQLTGLHAETRHKWIARNN